jgi:pseudouridine kinase
MQMKAKPSVAVVGGMNIDIQGKSFLPFRVGDSNPGSLDLVPGGVGRNIAENLARLGASIQLVTVLGDDDLSSILESSCASVGIGLEGALKLKDSPASRYLCLLDSDGSLAGAIAAMDSIDSLVPERLEERSTLLDAMDLIIVDANVPESSIKWLAERYPREGKGGPLLGFDPVSVKKAERGKAYLGSFAFAKPNRTEAAILADIAGTRSDETPNLSPDALSSALRAKGLGEAFVSLGIEGLWAEGGGPDGRSRERWIARLPEHCPDGLEMVSSSGAGDAACAAIAWGLLRGLGLGERCSLALAAAMLAAASESPVNPAMSAERLIELAKGIERERIS